MKKLFIMLTAISLLSFGMVSCDPTDDTTNNHTNPTNPTNPANPTTGDWVDLGLPSGLLWAKCNIGATTPEEYGNYYAWGETQTKEEYSWVTYIYGDYDTDYHLYKYNTSETYGTVDNKTVLEASDDVVTAVLGTSAKIPTNDDWVELRNNTTGEWTEQNGVNGWKFTATNGNSLFLPAAGWRYGSSLSYAGSGGCYWSSSLHAVSPYGARGFYFSSDSSGMDYDCLIRGYGLSVRAVRTR